MRGDFVRSVEITNPSDKGILLSERWGGAPLAFGIHPDSPFNKFVQGIK
jgi:hypothetical protein